MRALPVNLAAGRAAVKFVVKLPGQRLKLVDYYLFADGF
jgi:hypothetical protein